MNTEQGKPEAPARTVTPYTVTGTRNMRFGEILVVRANGIDIYNTTGLNDCPAALWDGLNSEALAKQLGALAIQKNGPHYWMMDSQTLWFGETVSFGGLEARWGATVDPAVVRLAAKGTVPYTVFNPKKTQRMVYAKGKLVYELVDPDGHVYVLQAREERFPIESLAMLGQQLKMLPRGWQFRSRTLSDDLVLDLREDQAIYGVGDEFHQYWMRNPKST